MTTVPARAWRTARVFISSTFRDMQAERDLLVRFVFPRLRDELLKRHVHLVDVDLRWGVTSDEDVLEACRTIIDECRPRFLCLLGGRYGWVPKGAKQSITHDEVEYAAMSGIETADSGFFYFRNESATASVPRANATEYRDSKRNVAKLDLLKKRISERGYTPFVYPARWDDARAGFVGLQEFGERVYADLKTAIESEFPLHDDVTFDQFAEEDAAVDSFVESRTRNYVVGSRRDVLDQLHRLADAGGLTTVVGEPGTGKSALMATFWRERLARETDSKVIGHFVGASPSSTNVRLLLRRLHHELAADREGADELPTDYTTLVETFPSTLEKATQFGHVVILIDGVDQLRAPYDPLHMRWLPTALADGVSIVISATPGTALDSLRDRHGRGTEVTLQPLWSSDVVAITDAYLARYQKRLDARQRAALFAKKDARRPLYLVAALEELRSLGVYEEITGRIQELPEETRPLFRGILKRLEAESGFRDERDRTVGWRIVPAYCSLLATSRFGMSQAELTELVSPASDGSGPDPVGNVASLHRLLRPYLVEHGDLLGFFHRQLEEAVIDEYLAEPSQLREQHRMLALYFGQRADRDGNRTWTGDARAMSELPYHLTHAELWNDVFATLTDFTYLERKAAKVGVVESTREDGTVRYTYTGALELLDDFSLALDRFPSDGEAGALAVLASASEEYRRASQLPSDPHTASEAARDRDQPLVIPRDPVDLEAQVTTHCNVGMSLLKGGDEIRALDHFQQALAIVGGLSNHEAEAKIRKTCTDIAVRLDNIGRDHFRRGDNGKALKCFERALSVVRATGDQAGEATVLHDIGRVHSAWNEAAALDYYHQALVAARAAGDRRGEADTLKDIGKVQHARGDRGGEVETLYNIGFAYAQGGHLEEALEYFAQTLPLASEEGNRTVLASTRHYFGRIFRAQGNPKGALDNYALALTLRRELDDRQGEADTLANMGVVYYDQGDLAASLDYFQQALTITRELDDRRGEATTLYNIGTSYKKGGDEVRALDCYQQAVAAARAAGDREQEARNLLAIADIHRGRGDLNAAVGPLEDGVAILQDTHSSHLEWARQSLETLRRELLSRPTT